MRRKPDYRKYHSYNEYVENVVNKCSHKWLILEKDEFRNWKFTNFGIYDNPKTKLPSGELIKVIPARCKSYSCPICGRKKVMDVMDKIKQVDFSKYRFFTLTLKNKYNLDDTEKNINAVTGYFNKLNLKLRKRPEFKGLEYLRIIEIGNDGMVHMHGIWNKYIPVLLLSKLWKTITKQTSYRVDVRRVKKSSDVVNYIFKYMTKNVVKFNQELEPALFNLDIMNSAAIFYENHKRRFATSRNFFTKAVKISTGWLPYYFEPDEPNLIEETLSYLVHTYKLQKDNFNFDNYFDSDQFLFYLFKPPPE